MTRSNEDRAEKRSAELRSINAHREARLLANSLDHDLYIQLETSESERPTAFITGSNAVMKR